MGELLPTPEERAQQERARLERLEAEYKARDDAAKVRQVELNTQLVDLNARMVEFDRKAFLLAERTFRLSRALSVCTVAGPLVTGAGLAVAIQQTRVAQTNAQAALASAWAAAAGLLEARTASAAAVRAAQTAEGQLDETKKSNIVAQRAWVNVESVEIKTKTGAPIGIDLNVTNYGQTPAVQVSVHAQLMPVRRGEKFSATLVPMKEPASVAVMLPQQKNVSGITASWALSERLRGDIGRGDLTVYVYADIRYVDVFGKGRHSTFCGFFEPTLDNVRTCSGFNKMD